MTAIATGLVVGPHGKPGSQLPPKPSDPQRWVAVAESDDDLADLLNHTGRTDGDWYELYKTLEVAKRVGNRHGGYAKILGAEANRVEQMRQTANFYRHASKATHRPPVLTTLDEALPLLRWVVRTILDAAAP